MASYEISLHPLEKIYIKNDTTVKVSSVDDDSSLMIVVDDVDKMMATKMVVVMTITMMLCIMINITEIGRLKSAHPCLNRFQCYA